MSSELRARGNQTAGTKVEKLIPKNNGPLLTWSELPEWMKDNEYIVSGYRKEQRHWKGCFQSVYSYLHNESGGALGVVCPAILLTLFQVNIHSHLWGGVLFLYFLTTANSAHLIRYPISWIDSAVFSVFLASAVFCLFSSAFFHISTCHSKETFNWCHAFDYSGIVILTVFYIASITLVGTGAAYIVLNPEYAKPTHRGARTAVFIALGLCAVFPVTHWVIVHGPHTMINMGLHWLAISGCFYLVGALLYANRIPERFSPGRFDYFFASHQIFHFFVVFAALAHYESIRVAVDHVYTQLHCV